jgi:hypothetical protein
MAVPFIACPSCDTLLLSDTVRCPECRKVLNENRLRELGGDLLESLPDKVLDESPCPSCNEMVKKGLVRCWSCSSFMREDIAQAYQRLQSGPRDIIYSQRDEIPTTDQPAKTESDEEAVYQLSTPQSDVAKPTPGPAGPVHEEDFELHESVASSMPAPQSVEEQPDTTQPPATVPTADSELPEIPEMTAPQANEDPPKSDAKQPESDAEPESSTPPDTKGKTQDEESHSEATGGDVLLQIALEEESEEAQPRKTKKRPTEESRGPADGKLRVHCPNGHRVDVDREFAGRVGRCPKCKARYIVPEVFGPAQPADSSSADAETLSQSESDGGDLPFGEYHHWMKDVHVHVVNPAKLKLKPGNLVGEFVPTDLGFAVGGLLLATLEKKGGLFGSGGKKAADVRSEVIEFLKQGGPLEDLPVTEFHQYPPETHLSMRVEQPLPSSQESIFAGIPVFGEGRIAIRLPQSEGEAILRFASFDLTEFRTFIYHMTSMFGPTELATVSDVPLEDSIETLPCHYSEQELLVIQQPDFYLADPQVETQLAGYQCQECGLVVSEDSRKKERIGGRTGKGIAKAKCPKCSKPFGNLQLYSLARSSQPESEPVEGE